MNGHQLQGIPLEGVAVPQVSLLDQITCVLPAPSNLFVHPFSIHAVLNSCSNCLEWFCLSELYHTLFILVIEHLQSQCTLPPLCLYCICMLLHDVAMAIVVLQLL